MEPLFRAAHFLFKNATKIFAYAEKIRRFFAIFYMLLFTSLSS